MKRVEKKKKIVVHDVCVCVCACWYGGKSGSMWNLKVVSPILTRIKKEWKGKEEEGMTRDVSHASMQTRK